MRLCTYAIVHICEADSRRPRGGPSWTGDGTGDDDGVFSGSAAPLTPAQIAQVLPMLKQMDAIKEGTRTTPLRDVRTAVFQRLLRRLPADTVSAAKAAIGTARPAKRAMARR